MKHPTVVDLFCGCGGFSTGLLDAGLQVVGGFDLDAKAIEAYNYNHNYRGSTGFEIDLSQASGQDLLNLLKIDSVDLLVGGPPCQAFSIAGSRKGLQDLRGQLIFDFVRLVGEIQPLVFILENVPNLKRIEGGNVYQKLIGSLESLGYELTSYILHAADYGVPQNRKRIFVLGVLSSSVRLLPPPETHFKADSIQVKLMGLPRQLTCKEVLEDLPDVGLLAAESIPNHEPTHHSDSALTYIRNLAPGQRCKKYFYNRLYPDGISYTLRAGSGNFTPLRPIHYHYDRVISVRESARIQGFSDTFIWPDSISRLQQYRQVGNAVCPLVAEALGKSICSSLGWVRKPGSYQGKPQARPFAFTKSRHEKTLERMSRIRGASLGSKAREI